MDLADMPAVTKPYTFTPFTPTLPNPLGDFHSFAG
jgi:hypothetical protein